MRSGKTGRFPDATVGICVAASMLSCAVPGDTAAQTEAPGTGNGISLEEHLRTFPPHPVAVEATFCDGKATVLWKAPQTPGAVDTLGYDPVIDSYRVYRIGPGHTRSLMGETRGTWFVDPAAKSGTVQRYAVTAVQRSGHESELSVTVRLRIP